MKKSYLSILVMLAMLASFLVPIASAETLFSGSCGVYAKWTLNDQGLLTISGKGEIDSYAFDEYFLPEGMTLDMITDIVIQPGLANVGEGAFGWNDYLETASIGEGLTFIDADAFYSCTSLREITLPSTLRHIGAYAFDCCYALSNVKFNGTKAQWLDVTIDTGNNIFNSVTISCTDGDIEYDLSYNLTNGVLTFTGTGFLDGGFTSDQRITKVVISSGLLGMPNDSFQYCYNLTSFEAAADNPVFSTKDGVLFNKAQTTLLAYPNGRKGSYAVPSTVTTIAEYAFSGSDYLTAVTLPDGLEEILPDAFFNCASLEEITIPGTVCDMGPGEFRGCDSLENIYVDADNPYFTSIDGVLFSIDSDDGSIRSLYAFPGGRSGKYTVPANTSGISGSAFTRCENLTEVVIPEGVDTIYICAFEGCTNLKTVRLPKSLTRIVENAFSMCDSLSDIYYAGTMADWDKIDIEAHDVSMDWATIHCSDGNIRKDVLSGACGEGMTYTLTRDGKLTVSGSGEWDNYFFSDNNFITEAVISDGIAELPYGAFFWCENMTKVTIPASVTLINPFSFYGCNSLSDVYYAGTMAAWEALLADLAEEDNYNLYEATIHCSDGDIAPKRDDDEPGDDGYIEIPVISLPFGLRSIDAEAFMGSDVEIVDISNGCTSIGSAAFKNCEALQLIFIPASVTSIADDAFDGCPNVSFVLGGSCYAAEYAKAHGISCEYPAES